MGSSNLADVGGRIHRIGGVVLLGDEDAALLQLRDNKPGLREAAKWVFPGGHRDGDESMEECARREMLEETSYLCGKLRWVTTFMDTRDPISPPYELTFFWTRYDGIQPVRCGEGQAIRFFKRNEAPVGEMPDYMLGIWDVALAEAARY